MVAIRRVSLITARQTRAPLIQALAQYVVRNSVASSTFIAVHIGTAWLFLRQAGVVTEPGMPLDDAWIHFVFARTLITHGQLAFNPGEPSAGATSFLWVFLLAVGYRLLGNMVAVAWILGVGTSLFATIGVFELTKELFADGDKCRRWALLITLGYAFCGVIVWHQLSGMETPLFLALGLLTILVYRQRRLALAGLLLGLLILTRIEGIVLLVLIAAMETTRRRENLTGLAQALLPLIALPAVLSIPALLFTYQTTGELLPTTLAGRRWLVGLERPLWALDPFKSLLEFPARWGYYIYAYLFMGIQAGALPFTVATSAFGRTRPINLLYLILVAGSILIGGAFFCRKLIQHRAWHPRSPTALGLFSGWVVLHNLAYLIFLPWTGHAGRYQSMNFVAVWLLVGATLAGLREMAFARGPRWVFGVRAVVSLSLTLLLLLNILSLQLWAGYYAHGVQRINSLHVQAARWIAQYLPGNARPAAFDIGAIRYFAQQDIVDLSGLTAADYLDFLYANRVTEYLIKEGVTHLALTEFSRPGDQSFNDILNIYRDQGQGYRLVPLQHYHVPYTDDALATSNAGSSMWIFRIQWLDADSDKSIPP